MIAIDADPLTRLRLQVDRFRADVERTTARRDALAATAPFDRTNAETVRIKSADADVGRATAGLRSAIRILRTAEAYVKADAARSDPVPLHATKGLNWGQDMVDPPVRNHSEALNASDRRGGREPP